MRCSGFLISTVIAVISTAAPAYGQLNRAYVSVAHGNDANACSYASPCRSIGKGVTVLNSGGELILIDGGGFTPFAIDRALSIQAPQSVFAGVISSSGSAIDVFAAPSDTVVLRGLTLTGVGATSGLYLHSGGTVHVEDMVIDAFATNGIISHISQLIVRRTVARGNGIGLMAYNAAAAVNVTIDDSFFDDNQYAGVGATYNTTLFASDTTASGNGSTGFSSGQDASVILARCSAINNSEFGLYANDTSTIIASDSVISYNGTGLKVLSGGQILSRLNNTLYGNAFDGTFSGSIPAR